MATAIKVIVQNDVEKIKVIVADVIGNSGSGNRSMVYFTPARGVSSFDVDDLDGQEVDMAFRSGLHKRLTDSATTNTNYLQINNKTVTLSTGDITSEDEDEEFAFKLK